MAKTTPRKTVDDILNIVVGEHGTIADGAPTVILIGGKFTEPFPGLSSGQAVTLWLSKEGFTRPYRVTFLLDSFTTSTGNGTGTAQTSLGVFKELDGLVDVTLADGTSPTLDIKIDAYLDGTNYYNIAHLTQISTLGKYAFHLTKNLANGEATLTSDAAAGTLRSAGFGDNIRVRRAIAGTSPSFTGRIWLNVVA